MTDVFLNVKRPRRVWFPENINGLYPLGKAEIGDDVYRLTEAIRNLESSSKDGSTPAGSLKKLTPAKKKELRAARESEIKSAKRKLNSLMVKLESQQENLDRIRSEIRRHRDAIGRTECEIETAEEEQKSLKENYQSLKEDYTQSIKSSKHNREGYDKSIREIREQLHHETKLSNEVFGTPDEVPRLKQEIQERNDHCNEIRHRLKGATRQRTMMHELLTKQSGPNPTQAGMLTQQLVEYARSSAKQYETFKIKLKDTIDKKKKTHQELERRRREIQTLTEDRMKQAKLNTGLKEKDHELARQADEQKDKLRLLQDHVRRLKEEEERRKHEIEQLNEQHDSWQTILSVTEKRAIVAEEALVRSTAEVRVYKLGKRTLEATTNRLRKKQKHLQKECEEVQGQLNEHKAGNGEGLREKKKIDAMVETCKLVWESKKTVAKELAEKESAVIAKKREIERLKALLATARERIHEQQEEHVKQLSVSTNLASKATTTK
mmetsp:Transcript_19046/g.31019  ORF Transcript_19046/g.31019 Transcript_19046/m.31019 type:complete len:493 (+) Transcript_19046:173-1651(+)|eukprot:jgi/Bigna1/146145/aug1.109_g20853